MNQNAVKLYRKRFIPNETVYLKDDVILYNTPEMLITKWQTLRPKPGFKYGVSCYYPKEGYKISKVFSENKIYKFTYIDIISANIDTSQNIYTFTDMLVDIVIAPDGFVTVLDLNELTAVFSDGLISLDELVRAINTTDVLLQKIYAGNLSALTAKLDTFIQNAVK